MFSATKHTLTQHYYQLFRQQSYSRTECAGIKSIKRHSCVGFGRYLDPDNYLFIVHRIKNIIIRGDGNISRLEVESALCHHPGVMEACIFGIPDERFGEVPAAVVCERDGATLGADELKMFLKAHLAAFKIPERFWIFRDRLPLGATRKIDRRGLRQTYRKRFETAMKGT